MAAGPAGDDGAGVAIWASLCVSKAESTGFPAGCDVECECQESSQRLQAEGQEGGSSVAQSRPHPTLCSWQRERPNCERRVNSGGSCSQFRDCIMVESHLLTLVNLDKALAGVRPEVNLISRLMFPVWPGSDSLFPRPKEK